MLNFGNFSVKKDNLIKIRLFIYNVTFIHLVTIATSLLNKDYASSKDPATQAYVSIKWKVLTAWFNLLTGPYLLLSIYCDWKELNRKSTSRNVVLINKFRNFLFSSIILPVTIFADVMFWRLYHKDRTLLMPLSADEFVSIWNHHSMHTISLVFVLFDLVCVPRKRPRSMIPHISALIGFLTIYMAVAAYSIQNGEYVYPGMRLYSVPKLMLICVYMYIGNLFNYTGQWLVVDMIWNQTGSRYKFLKNIMI